MSESPAPEIRWLTAQDLANMWQISPGTIANWRLSNKGPEFKRIGGLVRYHPEAVQAWEDAQASK